LGSNTLNTIHVNIKVTRGAELVIVFYL